MNQPIEVRPFADLDNGALLQGAKDALELLYHNVDHKGDEAIARSGLLAIEILEGRASFQGIQEFKE